MKLVENGEEPYRNIRELLKDYGIEAKELAKAKNELNFVKQIFDLKVRLESHYGTPTESGLVFSIQAPWGMGKTSFVNILLDEIKHSDKIDSQSLCIFKYDSLYYGNVSEAITIFIDNLFRSIEKTYSIKLHGVGHAIAKNLTPQLEVGSFFAKLRISQSRTSDTKSLISEKIKDKLCKIDGKVIVVIDDIDRLTGEEALFILRMVRVLKGLPNLYILLPIDFKNLVALLAKSADITNPGGYVRKIISDSTRLDSDVKDLEVYFRNNLTKQLNIKEGDESKIAEFAQDLWFGYLWELTLNAMYRTTNDLERPIRIQFDTSRNDSIWEKFEVLNNRTRKINFLRKFFDETRRVYTAAAENYLVRFNNPGNPDLFWFYPYGGVQPQTTFDRFFEGFDYTTQIGGGVIIEGGTDAFNVRLYKESELLALTGAAQITTDNERYEVNKATVDQLEGKGTSLWDLLKEKLEPNDFPEVILKSVSPRMIHRLINEFVNSLDETKIYEVLSSPRSSTNNFYLVNQNALRTFITEYADLDLA